MRAFVFALHKKLKNAAESFRLSEAEIIEILAKMDSCRGYLDFGRASLFAYAIKEIGLSEANAYNFIAVSRKSRSVPELISALSSGNITVSKA